MSAFFDELETEHQEFIKKQHMLFVSTAPAEGGRVNLSPKGGDCFRVIDSKRAGYLDQTGSGNETAAHTKNNGRLTFMFCSFEQAPLILRLYGKGRAVRPGDAEWDELYANFDATPGQRHIILMDIESVQTSCGYAVPKYEFKEHRDTLDRWAEHMGEDRLSDYWAEKNVASIDGLPTGV